jgi:hypothetical protein
MHSHRTERAPTPGSRAYRAQRALLLELVIDPPPFGERIPDLARRLDLPPDDVRLAARELEALGLAMRSGDLVHATAAALRFEALALVRP